MSKIIASCAWGDGPDVLVSLTNKELLVYPLSGVQAANGNVGIFNGAFCLTATEAKDLGHELIKAGTQASNLEKFAEHSSCPHCEQDWQKHGPCPCVE